MSLSTAMANAILNLLFDNANAANIGDTVGLRGSSAAGVFWVGLHTSSPGVAGSQNTNEVSYTGYGRVSVARTTGGWTASTTASSPNAAAIVFGECTALTATATYFSIGTDQTGAGHLVAFGVLAFPVGGLAISAGIIPEFDVAQLANSIS
jgi:hypothetical protein